MTERRDDYRDTVFLPATSFPMRGELRRLEPRTLARWAERDLWGKLRRKSRGRPLFILHDGPPYANGHLHIGTALNKILKDVVNRAHQMAGFDALYIPGWDCHGLPIEWRIEEEYRAQGRDKDAVPIIAFRAECRAYAEKWMGVQGEEFRRLGVAGAWADRYATMDFPAEAAIAAEIGKFLLNGALYRGLRPVMWSPVEKTALAEAEIEYHDHTSETVFVRFPLDPVPGADLDGAAVAIWTTTPWTIPGNRAIACGAEFDYALVHIDSVEPGSRARPGEKMLVALALLPAFCAAAGIATHHVERLLKGAELVGLTCRHPLAGSGYEHTVRIFATDFVTIEEGTGFVHIAPGHGEEDFSLGQAHGLEVPDTVGPDGTFNAWVPLFAGLHVYKAAGPVAAALEEAGTLIARGKILHSYPHSWRSKAPLIFRATPQWFIRMDGPEDIRGKALAAIAETHFVPPQGRTRLASMVAQRPDWCISRQRAWGVPIAVFVSRRSGEPLRDPAVVARIVEAFATEGADAWYSSPPERFLGPDRDPADYEQVTDIVDVWFESGSTHAFVLEARGLPWPADLYLEGSDQHRGWFQSSLLEAVGTRGRAPFEAVLTHGFVLDEEGRKMSKSLGNVIAPQEVCDEYGADILRLWVMNSDTGEDLRIGREILKQQAELYRRLRNTLRWLLGSLAGFSEAERVPLGEMPELERFVLHLLSEREAAIRRAVATHDWNGVYPAIHAFCAADLSAFYFDVRKDALYCDRPDHPRRRAARTVLDYLHRALATWLAPVLAFTAEEAWCARFGEEASVHLETFAALPEGAADSALGLRFARIREIRRVATGALERARASGTIGTSLQAALTLHLAEPTDRTLLGASEWAELAIVSALAISAEPAPDDAFRLADVPGVAVAFAQAPGTKCARCWRVLPEVGEHPRHPALCLRCADAVESGLVSRAAA
ncbi:MAG TPA: isoleucine--tRNA ligase [Acetobacteraceae bacterium]|nr:isoleucine--tRNA ligase [Acetobacteraceae bacterium]